MLIIRFAMIFSALLMVLSVGLYIFSRRGTYLRFAWQVLRFDLVLLAVFGVMYLLERYVLTAWRVLL